MTPYAAENAVTFYRVPADEYPLGLNRGVVVEHFFPGTEFPAGARVLGIADRVP
jgi:hypothetical protein